MKKIVPIRTKWFIDLGVFVVMVWAFGWLFCIVTGAFLLFDQLPFLGQIVKTSDIPYLVILATPSLIGLIMSTVLAFIVVKYHPSEVIYILVCAFLVVLPTLPFIKTTISALERSGELGFLCFSYIALGILLGNFIYQRIKSINNVSSISS